jgi:superfamily II DNA or RNA helicase
MTRDRDWLRAFLRLDVRAKADGISAADIQRQEDTVLRALSMLESRPGVVLADEVGMGKTFEALGVAAAFRHQNPKSRIVVITPGPDLNAQWAGAFSRFREMYDFGADVLAVRTLREFVTEVRERPVVVAPVTMFQSGRTSEAQTYLLSLYLHWKREQGKMHGHRANAIMARFKGGEHERVDVQKQLFLGTFRFDELQQKDLKRAFRRGRGTGVVGLDDIYEQHGLAGFEQENSRAIKSALYRARFALAGALVPFVDLLIVDEAHKLKNPGALRTRAMREVFHKGFAKAVFLTATPFQLDIGELRQMFQLFAEAKDAPVDLLEQIESLLAAVRDYQKHYEDFQRTWTILDPAIAARFAEAYDHGTEALAAVDDPTFTLLINQIANLAQLKRSVIEPGFREWMIRSLREGKREYRRHDKRLLQAKGSAVIPFLVYERFIAELFRRHRQTHKAAVEINMVSSYGAARTGAILADSAADLPPEAMPYRELMRGILDELGAEHAEHPKFASAIADALDAADRGEKTLVFCSRVETLEQLRRDLSRIWDERIVDKWRRVYPDASAESIFDARDEDVRKRGRHSRLQTRLHQSHSALYLALREHHLQTLRISPWALEHLAEITLAANLRLATVRVDPRAAERLDYQVAKRCVEQAALAAWRAAHPDATLDGPGADRLSHQDFLTLGLDHQQDDYENDSVGDATPTWSISEQVARLVIGEGRSLWSEFSPCLDRLNFALRVRVVEQVARYLTYKQVPFIADLLGAAAEAGVDVQDIKSLHLLPFIDRFWHMPQGAGWFDIVRAFLEYFVERDKDHRLEILDGPIRTGEFVRHTKDGESREKLREAFNTPFYPMILLANEVMQEGLDLHRNCRRIVHHDLTWNPAQIEQRIGRIDRLGSLTNRLRKNDTDVKLEVLYPVIAGTIDERLYRTVKTREKWLEFLLGAHPSFSEYSFGEEPAALPERLGRELAIDLGPGSTAD